MAAESPLEVLVIGGGRFVGRAIVEALLEQRHSVTVFNRGKTSTARWGDAAPEGSPAAAVRVVVGDRGDAADLSRLASAAPAPSAGGGSSGKWDVVIDCCCYLPGHASSLAEALRGVARRMVFISTVSVYSRAALEAPGVREDAELSVLPADASRDEMTGETYGALKVECEAAVRSAWLDGGAHGRCLRVVRPGLIIGPEDHTDRFTYWPVRVSQGGRMIAPLPQEAPLQAIDARDLANFVVRCAAGRDGAGVDATYNAVGPLADEGGEAVVPRFTFEEMLAVCREAAGAGCSSPEDVVWMDEEFVTGAGVAPWVGLPMWMPPSTGMANCLQADCTAAAAAGLRCRSLLDTVRDLLAWHRGRVSADAAAAGGFKLAAGPSPEREAEVLAAWDAKTDG